jgi:hypothetical protein
MVGKPEGKIPLGRPTRKKDDNSKMNFREVGWGGTDWIGLAQNRALVNTVMNIQIP